MNMLHSDIDWENQWSFKFHIDCMICFPNLHVCIKIVQCFACSGTLKNGLERPKNIRLRLSQIEKFSECAANSIFSESSARLFHGYGF